MISGENINQTAGFTDRQKEVIRCWAREKSIPAAAKELAISEHTLNTHLKRMRRKLGVHRTFEVYLYLLRAGKLAAIDQTTD